MRQTRRRFLRALGVGTVAGLAGCRGPTGGDSTGSDADGSGSTPSATSDDPTTSTPADSETPGDTGTTTSGDTAVPTAEASLHVPYDAATLREETVNGGPGKDGIPSIDDPSFAGADAVDLADGDPVFGLVRNGVVRAYPQYIVVWHEIVNDRIDGEGVAVTYCPLTGTVQGFERGDVEFGVSGDLVNSNLIMYDRETDSRWPQVLATAIEGPLRGSTLREFRLVWTTWGQWREAHPDTEVLTEDTGHERRYGSDPYGNYNPRRGYYEQESTLFPPLSEDDRAGAKDVVVGTRTADGAIAFRKESLLEEGILTGAVGDTDYAAVAEPSVETGYVYANPDGLAVEPDGDRYRVDGEQYGARELPLDRTLAFDAMWFAWAGFYPDTGYVE